MRAADRALAVQQIRLDALQRGNRSDRGSRKEEEGKTSADLLAQLREGISRLKLELGPDCENQNGLENLIMAETHLSNCMEALQNAENCVALSPLILSAAGRNDCCIKTSDTSHKTCSYTECRSESFHCGGL